MATTGYGYGKFDGQDYSSVKNTPRYFGGAAANTKPYVKGYFQVFFVLPSKVFDKTATQSETILYNNCIGFQPHGDRQFQKADMMGQGGVAYSEIIGQQITRQFSLTFDEKQFAPTANIMRKWADGIICPYTGLMTQEKYKAVVWVIQTTPRNTNYKGTGWANEKAKQTAADIQKVYIYDGVAPDMDPSSSFDAQLGQNQATQLQLGFGFDGQPITENVPGVIDKAVQLLNTTDMTQTFSSYKKAIQSKPGGGSAASNNAVTSADGNSDSATA